jgi:hypothetical protein
MLKHSKCCLYFLHLSLLNEVQVKQNVSVYLAGSQDFDRIRDLEYDVNNSKSNWILSVLWLFSRNSVFVLKIIMSYLYGRIFFLLFFSSFGWRPDFVFTFFYKLFLFTDRTMGFYHSLVFGVLPANGCGRRYPSRAALLEDVVAEQSLSSRPAEWAHGFQLTPGSVDQ